MSKKTASTKVASKQKQKEHAKVAEQAEVAPAEKGTSGDESAPMLAKITLDYSTQGDDLARCFEEAGGDVVLAFKIHSELLRLDADHLEMVHDVLAKAGQDGLAVLADTHLIMLRAPQGIIRTLLALSLAGTPPCLGGNGCR